MAGFGAQGWACYALSSLLTAALWGGLLTLACGRSRALRLAAAALAVALATLLLGSQRYFFGQCSTYLNRDALFFGASFGDTAGRMLHSERGAILRAHALPLLASLALLLAARRLPPPPALVERAARAWVPLALVIALFSPCWFRGVQACPPDVLALHAAGGLLAARAGVKSASEHTLPGARSPEYIPALVARPARPRNLVFILNESIRADAACSDHQPSCPVAPFSNDAAPLRLPLRQLRANDSSTTISVAVTLTGVAPNADRDEMHRAPTLWEFARAGGYDTAYWTSQDLRGIHSDMFVREVGARVQVAGYDLDPNCDIDLGADDALLSDRVARDIGQLTEPFVAVVHYANTHFPYKVSPEKSPFQPSEETKDPDKNTDYFNFYKNSVFLQDDAIAALLRSLRASPLGPRTVVAYTSDHGEAFREHYQLAHSLSLFDEEIHVPGWVDAPPGTLAPHEQQALEALRDTPVWHIDLLPTFLDLLGLWSSPELTRFRARLPGVSLLQPFSADRVVPLTNCTAVWGCPFRNWGLMRGPLKLEARAWDPDWHCWNVLDDPHERRDLGAPACGDLAAQAMKIFGEKPGGK